MTLKSTIPRHFAVWISRIGQQGPLHGTLQKTPSCRFDVFSTRTSIQTPITLK